MDEQEKEYKRMDEQEWNEKVDEEEEDKEEKAEGVTRAEMEMGMKIVEKEQRRGWMRRWGTLLALGGVSPRKTHL